MSRIDQPALQFRIPLRESGDALSAPTFERMMNRVLESSDFENDKECAAKLKIDPATLSCNRTGSKPWTVPNMRTVIERCNTLAPIAWLAAQYGHGLVILETEAERQIRELREQLLRERTERQLLEASWRRVVVGQATA